MQPFRSHALAKDLIRLYPTVFTEIAGDEELPTFRSVFDLFDEVQIYFE